MIRVTTNGVLKSYRTNLTRSASNLNSARNTVLSQRNFNSYAEDPAAATQAFKLRRSFLRTSSQYTNADSLMNKFNSAYTALEGVSTTVSNASDAATALESSIRAGSDTAGAGRVPLGKEMSETAKSIVQSLNAKYGDSFIFAGSDGLNVPFSWDGDGNLCYRGINVDAPEGSEDYQKLQKLAGEKSFIDVGLGIQEDANGKLIESSAFDSAISGLTFLGYGTDAEGLPNSLPSIMTKMGDLLSKCDENTGEWATPEDEAMYAKLQGKLKDGMNNLTNTRVEQDASTTFLKTTQEQLKDTAYTLNEQINSIEKCDLADAITSFSWAQYCYNAALKVGNSILSQSLIDYMN